MTASGTKSLAIAPLLQRLKSTQRIGSKPRCHFLTHGTREVVAERLTTLVGVRGVTVAPNDRWMPEGFVNLAEAQLGAEDRSILSDPGVRRALRHWWLAVRPDTTRTPNWDIASTCTVQGAPGVLLIEAKAHDAELRNEERGKPLVSRNNHGISNGSRRNHFRIGACIQEASLALTEATGLSWTLTRDWNYQMANRFTWAWKLTEIGVPAVLVYLGFLRAEEMRTTNKRGAGHTPFTHHGEWEQLVKAHSRSLFPGSIWNREWKVHGQAFIPIIRSVAQPLSIAS